MAKSRREPPKTPLGAWLSEWLRQHPDETHQALADAIGVSKGLISQWVSGDIKIIRPDNLRGLAAYTNEPYENLEQMVYKTPASAPRPVTFSPDLLDAIEARVRKVFRDEFQAMLRELRESRSE